jgi:hypothetical protein
MDVQWKNNFMNEGKYENSTFSSVEVNTDINPMMKYGGTKTMLYEPDAGTGLSGFTTSDFPEITVDIRGRDRTNQKLPGASQVSGKPSRFVPQKNLVGASFIKH